MNINIKLAVLVIMLLILVISCSSTKILINETSLGLKDEKIIYGTVINSKEFHNVILYQVKSHLDTFKIISVKSKKNNIRNRSDSVFHIRQIRNFRLLYPNMPHVISVIFQSDTIHFLYPDSVYLQVNRDIQFFQDTKLEKSINSAIKLNYENFVR